MGTSIENWLSDFKPQQGPSILEPPAIESETVEVAKAVLLPNISALVAAFRTETKAAAERMATETDHQLSLSKTKVDELERALGVDTSEAESAPGRIRALRQRVADLNEKNQALRAIRDGGGC